MPTKRTISFRAAKSQIVLGSSPSHRSGNDLPKYFSPSNVKYEAIHKENIDSPVQYEIPLERFREVSDVLPMRMRRVIERRDNCNEILVRVEEKVVREERRSSMASQESRESAKVLTFAQDLTNYQSPLQGMKRSSSRFAKVGGKGAAVGGSDKFVRAMAVSPLSGTRKKSKTPSSLASKRCGKSDAATKPRSGVRAPGLERKNSIPKEKQALRQFLM